MMAVALMSDTAARKKVSGSPPTWGKSRLGQSVLLVELTEKLRAIRLSKDISSVSCITSYISLNNLDEVYRQSMQSSLLQL